jgi:RNA polymerase sigma-70 factor (ECF subfamily)
MNRDAHGDDQALLTRLARGDLEALGTLYDRHAAPVRHFLLARGTDRERADDLVQEVFLALLARGREAAGVRSLVPYLLTIARRKAGRPPRHPDPQPLDDLVDGADGPEHCVESLAIRAALGRLPTEQREVVVLKVWHEMTFDEIARGLGISPNTAASRYRYATEKLRALLEDT